MKNNQASGTLVDASDSSVERITEKGVKTSAGEIELDMIVYSTGFDAVTGALNRIDIRGEGGQRRKAKWEDGPHTYLGMQTVGCPNRLTIVGPCNGTPA